MHGAESNPPTPAPSDSPPPPRFLLLRGGCENYHLSRQEIKVWAAAIYAYEDRLRQDVETMRKLRPRCVDDVDDLLGRWRWRLEPSGLMVPEVEALRLRGSGI